MKREGKLNPTINTRWVNKHIQRPVFLTRFESWNMTWNMCKQSETRQREEKRKKKEKVNLSHFSTYLNLAEKNFYYSSSFSINNPKHNRFHFLHKTNQKKGSEHFTVFIGKRVVNCEKEIWSNQMKPKKRKRIANGCWNMKNICKYLWREVVETFIISCWVHMKFI